MKLGLILNSQFLPSEDPVQRSNELLEQVRACRDGGFDSVYVVQHFLSDPFQALQLWPLLGRIAAESGEMQVGSSIFLLTLFNPIYAAEHAATMDVLTNGRFIFGVGLGFRGEEFAAFNVDVPSRAARFNESMDAVLRLLRGEQVSHDGRFFSLSEAGLSPRPIQVPHPPVWMAASGDLGVKRAARHGVSWLINPHATLATVRRQLDLYGEALEAAGHAPPPDIPLFRELAIAEDQRLAVARCQPHLETKYAAYADWGLDKPMSEDDNLSVPFDQLARDRFIVGSPDECVAEIRRYEQELGVTHLLARVQWPGMSHGAAMEQIELVATRVIPMLSAGK